MIDAGIHPLFGLCLTGAAFLLARQVYQRFRQTAWLHPTILGAGLVIVALKSLQLDYEAYRQSVDLLYFLLGPATVALAIPLYQQRHLIRKAAAPLLLTTAVGASIASLIALALAWSLGGSETLLRSLASKSITTPIAIAVSESIGGLASIAAGAVVFTGVIGIIIGPKILNWMKIEDDRVWGFSMGLIAHGIGTVRAFERSPQAGAFASLGLGLTGSFSALMIPLIASTL